MESLEFGLETCTLVFKAAQSNLENFIKTEMSCVNFEVDRINAHRNIQLGKEYASISSRCHAIGPIKS